MRRKIVADLHNHTTASDGEYTPIELVFKAKNLGLKAIGLTDHDTIDSLDEAIAAAENAGLKVIPGVEVSLAFRRPYFIGTLHLLLYFSKELLQINDFKTILNEILSQGRGLTLVRARVNAINEEFGPQGEKPLLKQPLMTDELTSYSSNVTRRHFALALKEKHGINDNDRINEIIGNNSPAYIPSGIDMKLLIPLLQQFPVLRVIAHPAAGSFPGENHYKEVLPPIETVEQLLPEFLNPKIIGIDGIEIHYPGHTHEHRLLLFEWAEKYRLFVSGGSDCHDSIQRPFGVAGLIQNELEIVLAKITSNSKPISL